MVIMLGGLVIHGIVPKPQPGRENFDLFWAIVATEHWSSPRSGRTTVRTFRPRGFSYLHRQRSDLTKPRGSSQRCHSCGPDRTRAGPHANGPPIRAGTQQKSRRRPAGLFDDSVSGLPMAGILFAGQQVSLIVLPPMLFHLIQLAVCAIISRRIASRPIAAEFATSISDR